MRQNNQLLLAFDAEEEHLSSNAGVEMKRIVRKVAKWQRAGLAKFCDHHGRLPKTVTELLASDFAPSEFRRFFPRPSLPMDDGTRHEIPVRAFLRETQSIVDGERLTCRSTAVALKLVHAVYRADDQFSHWKTAAKLLLQRGFTEEQISCLRTDVAVRKACRRLLRPYHR